MKIKRLFLCLMLIAKTAFAVLPITPCHSICQKKLTTGKHCIQLGQQLLYYRVLGAGKPTLIFSSGTGFPADAWYESGIAAQMAKKTQVLSYDRLYTFNSCPNNNNYMPNTAQDIVERLRSLLKQADVRPPYVLVGHSFGGLYMLLFAREYPTEVAGLVLMDATADDGPTPLPIKALTILTTKGNPQNPVATDQLYNEAIGQLPSYIQVKNAPPLPKNMPLIVMYATKHCLPSSLTEGKPLCMTEQQEAHHLAQQLKIFNMSNNHVLYKVNGQHMSFFEPANHTVVIKALTHILTMA